MPRPATSRAVADEIARSYERFDRNELINILSYLTKVYVVDGTMPFNLTSEGGKMGQLPDEAEKELTFAKLIDQLKKRLPKMKELTYFHHEAGKVTLIAGNQKVTFGERVTVEFVAASQSPPPRDPSRTAPEAIGAAASAGAKAAKKDAEAKEPKLSDSEQEVLHDIATRFSNLELD